jgi:multimeric flavodoxin WrbA
MKALALVVSARERGNGYDMAEYVLEHLSSAGVETELANFFDYRILPCHECSYECLDFEALPDTLANYCPIDDDVPRLWQKVWDADILLLFVPTYRGFPPASWFAFLQRFLGIKLPPESWQALQERQRRSVVSAVVLASPDGASGGEWTPAIVAANLKLLKRKTAAFEVINNYGYATRADSGRLLDEAEVRRRLTFLAQRTLTVAHEVVEGTYS